MMSGKILMNLLMLAIFVVMVGIASQYPPQARFMPMVVGIPGIVLCLLQLVLEFREHRGGTGPTVRTLTPNEQAQQQAAEITQQQLGGEPGDTDGSESRREKILWACLIALVASIILFGFWPTIPAFLVLFLRYFAGKSWTFSLGLGIGGTLVLLLVFHFGLGVVLHSGLLTDLVIDRVGGP